MASGSQNMTTYNARIVTGSNNAASPAGALLLSGAGRADNATGDTWIFLDSLGGLTNPWGIKHDQANNKLQIFGSGTNSVSVRMNTGDTYILGKVGIGYDPETSGNTYKLYVNGSSYFTEHIYIGRNDSAHIYLINKNWTKGTNPSSQTYSAIEYNDTNNSRVALLEATLDTSGNSRFNIYLVPNVASSTSWSGIVLQKTNADVLTVNIAGATTVSGTVHANGGYLKSTANGNTVTIGSQNTGFAHIQSSANIPFYFNRTTLIDGDLGNTSYPVKNITIGKDNGAGIYYQGSKANYRMIRFIDNATDNYGNGISIGGGGQTIIGGGESADTAAAQVGTGGSEIMYVCNDGQIDFYSNLQNGWSSGKHSYMDTSGNFITANNLAVAGSAGNGYGLSLYNGAGNVQNYGIWCGLASTYGNFGQVTHDWNMYFGMAGNRYRGWVFRGPGGSKASINTYGEFSGRAIHMYPGNEITNSYNEGARIHVSSGGWATIMLCGSDNTGATGTSAKSWGIFNNDGTLYINRATSSGAGASRAYANSNGWYFDKAYGAVWNDFAEFRQSDTNEPGRVIIPSDDGIAHLSIKRLQSGGRIISDTYGFSVGASDKAKTPVGISGRVLVYPYQNRENYNIGDAVCTAPNGTVDVMSREEIKEYPERIIGIVNEIPNYEIWEESLDCPGGEPTTTKIIVNGRIWIDIK